MDNNRNVFVWCVSEHRHGNELDDKHFECCNCVQQEKSNRKEKATTLKNAMKSVLY
jgi:hypothetical protein